MTVDEYIEGYPSDIQRILSKIRQTIIEAAPEIEETISYRMPAYKLNGKPLVYFAVFKRHIGFYPTPSGLDLFKEELKEYKQGRGSIQFPLEKPMPLELIKKIVQQRVKEIKETAKKN